MRKMVARKPGGPEVIVMVEAPEPVPAPGEVVVRSEAIGVNFADVWTRLGVDGEPPWGLGIEVVGVVEAVGPGVTGPAVGDRVAGVPYAGGSAYAELVAVPADLTFPVPGWLDPTTAAALPLHYLTAYAAVEHAARPRPGERVLVHAAAGGVGLAAVQLARRHRVEIYGTASGAKHDVLRAEGVAHPIDYRTADWVAELRRLAADGVDIVIDGVGEDAYRRSIDVTRYGGRVIAYGYTAGVASRSEATTDLAGALGSVGLYELLAEARGVIGVHLAGPTAMLRGWWADLLAWTEAGEIAPRIDRVLPLADAATAHEVLHDRANVGKIVLEP